MATQAGETRTPQEIFDGLSAEDKVQYLFDIVTKQQCQIEEIHGYFDRRELAVRIDRVIVMDLLVRVKPLGEFSPDGAPLVLKDISSYQLYHMLNRKKNQFNQGFLPFSMGSLKSIANSIWELKQTANEFAHHRVLQEVTLDRELENVLNHFGDSGKKMIKWIGENYKDYLLTGREDFLKNGKQVPFHAFLSLNPVDC